MNPTDAVATIVSELDDRLSVPVRTSGMTDERPVPVVLVEDWQMDELNFHNSAYVGTTTDIDLDDDGVGDYARWYRFYYDMRVELVVRHNDDVAAHDVLGQLQNALFTFDIDPQALHPHVNDVSVGTSGNLSYQFVEPKETEINQTFSLTAFHQVSRTDFDTLDEIRKQYNIS